MKEKVYETPVMEVEIFVFEDVVCSSINDISRGDNSVNADNVFGGYNL